MPNATTPSSIAARATPMTRPFGWASWCSVTIPPFVEAWENIRTTNSEAAAARPRKVDRNSVRRRSLVHSLVNAAQIIGSTPISWPSGTSADFGPGQREERPLQAAGCARRAGAAVIPFSRGEPVQVGRARRRAPRRPARRRRSPGVTVPPACCRSLASELAVGVVLRRDQELRLLGGAQLRDAPLVDEPACPDHHHVVADLLDLRDQVARDQHRDPVAGERPDQAAHLDDARRVQAVGRLVEDQQLGTGQHGRRDAEPLLHPQRVRAVPVPRPGQQAGPLEHRVDRGQRKLPEAGQRLQVLAAAQLRVERGRLDERADLAQVGRGLGEAAAQDRSAARRRADQAEQHPDRRGLAGPVRADEPADRPRGDGQRHVVDNGAVAEALGQPGRRHGERPARPLARPVYRLFHNHALDATDPGGRAMPIPAEIILWA